MKKDKPNRKPAGGRDPIERWVIQCVRGGWMFGCALEEGPCFKGKKDAVRYIRYKRMDTREFKPVKLVEAR